MPFRPKLALLLLAGPALLCRAGFADADTNPDGSFGYRIPIDLPESQSRLQPELSLDFNSNGGDGVLGLGWQLGGLPAISRMSYGAPVRYEGTDTYVGPSGRLVKPSSTATYYHGEIEDWIKYERSGTCGDGPCSFTASDGQGRRYSYGASDNSREWNEASTGIRVWALEKVEDTHGNFFQVGYSKFDGRIYPVALRYTSNASSLGAIKLLFSYEPRTDDAPVYDQGTRVTTTRRLSEISVTQGGIAFRRYRFGYVVSGLTGRSMLQTLQKLGNDDSVEKTWSFDWTNDGNGTFNMVKSNPVSLAKRLAEQRWRGDVNGDGYTDFIQRNDSTGELTVLMKTPTGFSTPPGSQGPLPDNWNPGYVWSGDFNGDGRTDLAMKHKNTWQFIYGYLSRGDGTFEQKTWTMEAGGYTDWDAPDFTFPGDFNGDGKTDIATRHGNQINVHFSNGNGFASGGYPGLGQWSSDPKLRWVADFDGDGRSDFATKVGNNLVVLRSQVGGFNGDTWPLGGAVSPDLTFLGDFNGDGKTDLVSQETWTSTTMTLHLSTGRGFVAISLPAILAFSMKTGDFNGDGRTDLIRFNNNDGDLRVYLSEGDGFSLRTTTNGEDFSPTGSWLIREVVDYLGNGVSSLALFDGGPGFNAWMRLPFIARDQMTSIHAGFASTTPLISINYMPAPWAGNAVMAPYADCGGGIGIEVCGVANPSPRLLVTKVRLADGKGNTYTTHYDYFNGRVFRGSPDKRADLGFQSMTATDEQTKIQTTTTFLQVKPFQGMITGIFSTYVHHDIDDTNILLTATVHDGWTQYGCDESGCTADGAADLAKPKLFRPATSTTISYETGVELYRVIRSSSYDAFGNTEATTETTKRGTLVEGQRYTSQASINQTAAPRAIGLPYIRSVCSDSTCQERELFEMSYYGSPLSAVVPAHLDLTKLSQLHGSLWADTTREYDSLGNLKVLRGPDGLATLFDYQPNGGLLRSIDDPVQGITELDIDPRYNLPTTVRHRGLRTVTVPDAFGRPQLRRWESIATGAVLRAASYALATDGTSQTECHYTGGQNQLCTTNLLDALGRTWLASHPGPSGPIGVRTEFGALERVSRVSAPYPLSGNPVAWKTIEYDEAGRQSRVIGLDGLATQTTYNDVPLVATAVSSVSERDPRGVVATRQLDARGQVTRVTEGQACGIPPGCAGLSTDYAHDGLGRLRKVTKPDGQEIVFGYDAVGRRSSVTDPNTGTTTWTYHDVPGASSFDRLKTETRPSPSWIGAAAVVTTLGYDARGRLETRTVSDGSSVTLGYDASGSLAPGDRPLTMDVVRPDFAVSTMQSYDLLDQPTDTQVSLGGQAPGGIPLSFESHLTRSYDPLGRRAGLLYPDGSSATYGYHWYGPLQTAQLGSLSATYGNHDLRLHPGAVLTGDGAVTTYGFDPEDGRLATMVTQRGGTVLSSRSYGYDAARRIMRIIDGLSPELSASFTYDGVGRLVEAERDNGQLFSYAYDSAGNLVSKSRFTAVGGISQHTQTFGFHTNHISSDGAGNQFFYSDGGNLIGKGDWAYAYDVDGELSVVDDENGDPRVRSYRNHDGVEVAHVAYQGEVALVTYDVDGLYTVREKWSGGIRQAFQVTRCLPGAGEERLACETTGDDPEDVGGPGASPIGVAYYHADHLGSTSFVTDGSGAVTMRATYSPFGELDPAHSSGPLAPHLFTGQTFDFDGGLYDFGARAYDPSIGMFTSADDTVLDSGTLLDWNRYSYSRNNPISFNDPSGHFIFLAIGIGIAVGAIIGGTEGDILRHPGDWTSWDHVKDNWSWKGAAVGGVMGGIAGAGWGALGYVGGTVFGAPLSGVLQGALQFGIINAALEYGEGTSDPERLLVAFASGAVGGAIGGTGFFGLGPASVFDTSPGFWRYMGTMAANYVTQRGLDGIGEELVPRVVDVPPVEHAPDRAGAADQRTPVAGRWIATTAPRPAGRPDGPRGAAPQVRGGSLLLSGASQVKRVLAGARAD